MRFVRILINFTFLIIANAMLPFDDQGSTKNSGSDNLLNPFNSDSAAISDNFYPDHNVAPEQENVQSINYLNPDIAGGKGDSISISDSGKCASNLGKREDNGFTSGIYCVPQEPLFFSGLITETTQPGPVDVFPRPNQNQTTHYYYPTAYPTQY